MSRSNKCDLCDKVIECTKACHRGECGIQSIHWVKYVNPYMRFDILPHTSVTTCFCNSCYIEYLCKIVKIDRDYAESFVDDYINCFIGDKKRLSLDEIIVLGI